MTCSILYYPYTNIKHVGKKHAHNELSHFLDRRGHICPLVNTHMNTYTLNRFTPFFWKDIKGAKGIMADACTDTSALKRYHINLLIQFWRFTMQI